MSVRPERKRICKRRSKGREGGERSALGFPFLPSSTANEGSLESESFSERVIEDRLYVRSLEREGLRRRT